MEMMLVCNCQCFSVQTLIFYHSSVAQEWLNYEASHQVAASLSLKIVEFPKPGKIRGNQVATHLMCDVLAISLAFRSQ